MTAIFPVDDDGRARPLVEGPTSTHTHAQIHITFTHIYTHVCMYIHTYIHTHIHIHSHKHNDINLHLPAYMLCSKERHERGSGAQRHQGARKNVREGVVLAGVVAVVGRAEWGRRGVLVWENR